MFFKALPKATRLLTGVAKAKAQGQAIIKTAIALTKEISKLSSL